MFLVFHTCHLGPKQAEAKLTDAFEGDEEEEDARRLGVSSDSSVRLAGGSLPVR